MISDYFEVNLWFILKIPAVLLIIFVLYIAWILKVVPWLHIKRKLTAEVIHVPISV